MKAFWKQWNKGAAAKAVKLFALSVGATALCMLGCLGFLSGGKEPSALEASIFNGGKEFSHQEDSAAAAAAQDTSRQVIPLGSAFGIKLFTDGVIVASLSDIYTEEGVCCPAAEAGILPGDYLLQADGQDIPDNGALARYIGSSQGEAISFQVRREDQVFSVEVTPVYGEGSFKTGMWVRDSAAGIGTLTFYDPATGVFAGLGHGTDVWLGNARDLIVDQGIPVGQAIGCRDDIMIFLISCGMPEKRSFKIMEAVRKGRGLPEGAEEEMKAAGVPDWYIGSCKKIKYLFPKAHAVAYVMMAFRIAWFKVHRPLAFYAAFFSIRAKAFDATFMCQGMDVCKAKMREIESKEKPTPVEEDILVTLEVVYEFYLRGFTFEHMDLYRSHAVNFLPDNEKNSLLPPFTSVPGLGETAAWSIMEQRKGKQFISIEEFSAACPKVSKSHIEQLKAAGALDGMPDTSQITLFDGF